MNNLRTLSLALVITIGSGLAAQAQVNGETTLLEAGRESGGGSFAIINGKKRLSDPYYKAPGHVISFQEFHPDVRNYVFQAVDFLMALGLEYPKFYEDTIAGIKAVYIMVPDSDIKDVNCAKYLPPLTINPTGHEQFGCTPPGAGPTYLFESKLVGAEVEEIGMGIMHERLWMLKEKVDQRFIAMFTTILGKLLQRREAQVLRGDRTPLSDQDLRDIDRLQIAAFQLGFSNRSFQSYAVSSCFHQLLQPLSANIHRNGGGLKIPNYFCKDGQTRSDGPSEISADAFIGLGSRIQGRSWIDGRAVIVNSAVEQSTVKEDSEIFSSGVYLSSIRQSKIRSSYVARSQLERSTLEDSVVSGMKMVADSRMRSSNVVSRWWNDGPKTIQFADLNKAKIAGFALLGTKEKPIVIEHSQFNWRSSRSLLLQPGFRAIRTTFSNEGVVDPGGSVGTGDGGPKLTMGEDVQLEDVQVHGLWLLDVWFAAGAKVRNLSIRNVRNDEGVFGLSKPSLSIEPASSQGLDFGGGSCTTKQSSMVLREVEDLPRQCVPVGAR